MLKELKNFFKEEEGGADQLIVAAVLVMMGISVAILFGNKIKTTVEGYMKSFKTSDEIEKGIGADGN